jgi:hypothetical protein
MTIARLDDFHETAPACEPQGDLNQSMTCANASLAKKATGEVAF